MKYELEKDEFIKIHDTLDRLFNRAFDLIEKEIDNNHKRWEKRFEIELQGKKLESSISENPFDDLDEEESSSEEDSNDNQPIDIKHKHESDLIQKGKKVWWDLMDLWVVNFDEEGEQPDRAELLRDLSISKNGIYLLHYLRHVGKLTLATYEYVVESEYIHDELSRKKFARKIAEHISQCSSILFYQISDFLSYPNPLDEE